MKRKIFLLVLLIIIVGGVAGYMVYNKPHENLRNSDPAHRVEAKALFTSFESDESAANDTYLGDVIQVKGTVREVTLQNGQLTDLILEAESPLFGVNCEMDQVYGGHRNDVKAGEEITLNCICSGYTMDVVMSRCVEIKSK